jgi:ADP-ribose pyrophosphatase YjhB (NUDIX family)
MIAELAGFVWKNIPQTLRRKIVRISQPKFTVSAAAVVTDGHGNVLLLDHKIRPRSGWGLPGGFLEHGEHPAEGIRRELREETGIELAELSLVRARTVGTHMELLFRARASGQPEVKSGEIRGLDWFGRGDLPQLMLPAQKAFVLDVLEAEFEKGQAAD